jgi:lysyl-tRNA synthetase class 1
MDGMRKIPDNVPDRAFLEPHLHKPLTSVPDPFGGEYESFGHHNNAMLRRFLDTFGFDYEFASATDYYKQGRFDAMLLHAAERYDDIMKVMLPTLGAERQATYSPFLPISPTSGRVLYVPMKHVDAKAGTITFDNEDGVETTLDIRGGRVKLQWKPDFGMRWAALDVDFEMFGKDHQTNQVVYDRICSILGGKPPEHFVYELFLDENGEKISKSKGNGITIDQWLAYAPTESLSLYMFQKPRTAKRLYFDVIPKAVDEYYTYLAAYRWQDAKAQVDNPVWHIHSGNPPEIELPVPFALLLNLVSASNAQNKEVLWGFISRYAPGVTAETHPELDRLTGYAICYFDDFVKPTKTFRAADEVERQALSDLSDTLGDLPADADGEAIQNAALNVARRIERYQDHGKKSPEGGPGVSVAFFAMIYQVLIGQERGPRFGSFAALYGIEETRALIATALAGELK